MQNTSNTRDIKREINERDINEQRLDGQSLDEQRFDFARRRFLATPLAGAICWTVAGLGGIFLSDFYASWLLFIATGSIVYLAMFIARFTGENFFRKGEPKNVFDKLFFHAVLASFLVYAIAIPFFLVDHSSLPLTVGILTGTMWLPFSWIIQHWIGTFHGIIRTLLIVAAWYLFPEQRFVVIPFV